MTTDRDQAWAKIETEVRSLRDGLGTPVDPGILDCVVGLWAHGIHTLNSCEGHVDVDPYRWVYVGPYDLSEGHTLAQRWDYIEQGYRLQLKTLRLLERFYAIQPSPSYRTQLQLASSTLSGDFTLQPIGGEASQILPEPERQRRLSAYQDEISRFARFLKSEFLASGPVDLPALDPIARHLDDQASSYD